MTFWSPTKPVLQKPGGKAWWATAFAHVSASLQRMTTAMAGVHADLGIIAASTPTLSTSLAATMQPAGTIAATHKPAAASLAGAQTQTGTIATILPKSSTAAAGGQTQQGAIVAALPAPVAAALAGGQAQSGTIAPILPKLLTTAAGAQAQTGAIADVLPAPITAAAGAQIDAGTIAAVLPAGPATLAAGAEIEQGAIATMFGQLSTAAAGAEQPGGTITAALQKAATAVAAAEQPGGTITAALQLAAAAITGGQTQQGSVAAALSKASAILAGAQAQSGTMAASLGQALTALAGNVTAPTPPAYTGASTSACPDTTTVPKTLTENVPAGTNLAVVWVNDYNTSTTGAGVTATLGGVSMTQTAKFYSSTHPPAVSGYGWLYCFTLFNPPTGSGKTLSVSSTNTLYLGALGAAYYSGVTSLGTALTAQTAAGTATMTHAVGSSNANYRYAQAFASTEYSSQTFTSYNQTQRAPAGDLVAGSVNNSPLVYGDTVGNGSTVTFTATRNETTETAGSIVLPLVP